VKQQTDNEPTGPTLEPECPSAIQYIITVLRYLKLHYLFAKSVILFLSLARRIGPQNPPLHKIHFNIILPIILDIHISMF